MDVDNNVSDWREHPTRKLNWMLQYSHILHGSTDLQTRCVTYKLLMQNSDDVYVYICLVFQCMCTVPLWCNADGRACDLSLPIE